MKRSIVASILGLTACLAAVSSYGQGQTKFDNYDSVPYYPVTYTSNTAALPASLASKAGQGVDGTFDVELAYFIGSTANPALLTMLPSTIEAINATKSAPPNGVGAPQTGYFDLITPTINGYTSAHGPVTFAVFAWETTGPYGGASYGSSLLKTLNPVLFTESQIAYVGNPANPETPQTWASLPANFSPVEIVPEPATFTLLGLGAGALMMVRRRK